MDNDDYTARMTRLIHLMRTIGNDTQQCEVKECRRHISTTMAETLSAFSNGNGGYVILGLSEKAGFTPVEGFDARAMQESLSQVCERLTPPVRPVIVTCPFEGANLVFAVVDEMLPREKPCYITAVGPHGGSYIRTGDGDRKMTDYEFDRLLEEQRQPEHDVAVVAEATPDDLDPGAARALLDLERSRHPHVFAGRSDDDMLLDLRVLGADDVGIRRPTLAGLLALGRYPQKYYPRLTVTIAVYPGTSREEVFAGGARLAASRTIVGPIPTMIADTVEAVAALTGGGPDGGIDGASDDGTALGEVGGAGGAGGAGDGTYPAYPPLVLREVVANALVHRDYSPDALGTPVIVEIFADRIEVTNPGGLYGAVSKRRLTREALTSARNAFLVALLQATAYPGGGTVLGYDGTGYTRIGAELRHELREPVRIDNSLDRFRIIIPGRPAAA